MTHTSGPAAPAVDLRGQTRNLVVATARLRHQLLGVEHDRPARGDATPQQMGLDGNQKALLVATPVLVGALGRILAGALTDRFGGRLMFPVLIARDRPVRPARRRRRQRPVVRPDAPLRLLPRDRRARRSRSASPSSTPGTRPTGAGSPPACSAPGWAARRSPRSSRRGSSRGSATPLTHVIIAVALVAMAAICWFTMTQLAGVEAQHRPGRPEARGRDEAARDLADVVPVRRRLRRLRRLHDLPADLPQGHLRLRPHRRGHPDLRLRHRRRGRPSHRRHPRRPDRAAERRRHLAGRHGGPRGGRGVPAAARAPGRRDLRPAVVRPRARHGRGVRLGGASSRRRSGSAA